MSAGRSNSVLFNRVVSWPVALVILGVGMAMIYTASTTLSFAQLGAVGTVVATAGAIVAVVRFLRG